MQIFLTAWLAITILTVMVWLVRHFQLSRAARIMPPLESWMYAKDVAPLPTVSLLVAAKDERTNIESCVRSLISQDYPALEVLAINDRSTDGTGAILDRVAKESPNLTAIHVQTLREGWFGKNNAMREGVARSSGEWLCFTDADCVQTSRRSLRIAMNYAMEKGLDFLSVLPAHETGSFWENVIQPACSGIMMIWFDPMKVNNPRRKTAYANGAFMLMKRSCYEAIGGHEAVKRELNEDMHMARLAKEAGLRLAVASNVDLYTVRMYESFAQTVAGWSRIFYGCFGTLPRLAATGLAMLVFSLLPWLTLVSCAAALADGVWTSPTWPALCLAAAAACFVQWSVMHRFYRLCRLKPGYALLYPLGAAVGLWAVGGAIRRLGGRASITWRGTTYRGGQVDQTAEKLPASATAAEEQPLATVSK